MPFPVEEQLPSPSTWKRNVGAGLWHACASGVQDCSDGWVLAASRPTELPADVLGRAVDEAPRTGRLHLCGNPSRSCRFLQEIWPNPNHWEQGRMSLALPTQPGVPLSSLPLSLLFLLLCFLNQYFKEKERRETSLRMTVPQHLEFLFRNSPDQLLRQMQPAVPVCAVEFPWPRLTPVLSKRKQITEQGS